MSVLRFDLMAQPQWILPRADARCGRVFHPERKGAEGYRVALEFWNRATGQQREGYRLAVFRCKRCGGFHVKNRRIEETAATANETVPVRPGRNGAGEIPSEEASGRSVMAASGGGSIDRHAAEA